MSSSDSSPLLNVGSDIIRDAAVLLASAILYGVQLILQWICVIILLRPTGNSASWRARILLLVATLSILLSSSIFMAFSAALPILDGMAVSNHDSLRARIEEPYSIALIATLLFNLMIGDMIVFWRAYVLWIHKRSMVYVPGILLLCTAAGVISVLASPSWKITSAGVRVMKDDTILQHVTLGLSITTNLTANASIGYYTWLHRKAVREYLDADDTRARPERDLVLVLYIGIIYTAILILGVVLFYTSSAWGDESSTWALVHGSASSLGMGLVSIYPSLLIVVIFLRKSIWDPAGNMLESGKSS